MNRLKEKFLKEVSPALMSKFEYKSVMQVPKVDKIVINMGVGDVVQDGKVINGAVEDLRIITGQHPKVSKARKSIANFRTTFNDFGFYAELESLPDNEGAVGPWFEPPDHLKRH